MGRFALMEFLITLGVLLLIFKVMTWIIMVTKKETDKIDDQIKKGE